MVVSSTMCLLVTWWHWDPCLSNFSVLFDQQNLASQLEETLSPAKTKNSPLIMKIIFPLWFDISGGCTIVHLPQMGSSYFVDIFIKAQCIELWIYWKCRFSLHFSKAFEYSTIIVEYILGVWYHKYQVIMISEFFQSC